MNDRMNDNDWMIILNDEWIMMNNGLNEWMNE